MTQLRRLIWHIALWLTVVTLVTGLLVTAFYYAMNMTNVYVVLKDGMARRTQVVMMTEDISELRKYFYDSFLNRDAAVQTVVNGTSPYQDYNIVGIDHRLEMGFTWVWPWDTSARVDIVERVPAIDGRIKGNVAEEYIDSFGSDALYPPDWISARYRATLVKENGQWKILNIQTIERLE